MTELQVTQRRSRRALLAGALGGIGAVVAGAIGRASPLRAEGEAVVVGGDYNTATSTTTLASSTQGVTVLRAENTARGTAIEGVSAGDAGVVGESDLGFGVLGRSRHQTAVFGVSDDGAGGVFRSDSNVALVASSGPNPPLPHGSIGIMGAASADATSRGVWGRSEAGHAIHGQSHSGWAGYFDGKVFTEKYIELAAMTTPGPPASDHAKLFLRQTSTGRTQVCVKFHNGVTRVLATS